MISRAQIKKNVRNQLIFHIASAEAAIKFVCFCSCTGGGGGGGSLYNHTGSLQGIGAAAVRIQRDRINSIGDPAPSLAHEEGTRKVQS